MMGNKIYTLQKQHKSQICEVSAKKHTHVVAHEIKKNVCFYIPVTTRVFFIYYFAGHLISWWVDKLYEMNPNENENTSHVKRKANSESYSRNIIKSRIKGEPHKNYKGDNIPGRTLYPPCRLVDIKYFVYLVLSPIYSIL